MAGGRRDADGIGRVRFYPRGVAEQRRKISSFTN